jgi:hypothetical protein
MTRANRAAILPGHERTPMRRVVAVLARMAACALVPATAGAQPSQAQVDAVRQNCRSDFIRHCSHVPRGGPEALACLRQHASEVAPACRKALDAMPAPKTPKPAAAASIMPTTKATAQAPGKRPHRVG